jgi:hypothetical protein
MIKPVLKYCIPIYLVLGYITMLVGRRTIFSSEASLILLVLIAVIIALGLFIGLIISVLARKPNHERKFYGLGQIISFALIVSFIIYGLLIDTRSKRSMAEENEVTIRELTDTITRPYVLRAYNNLQSKFNSPNDLEIHSITEIQQPEGFTIYFVYTLFNTKSKEYYSKYEVSNTLVQLVQFNLDKQTNPGFFKFRKQQEAELDTVAKVLETYEEKTK